MTNAGAASSSILVVPAYWRVSTRGPCDVSPLDIRDSAFLLQRSRDGNPDDKRRSSLGHRAGRMRGHWKKHRGYQLIKEITVRVSYVCWMTNNF